MERTIQPIADNLWWAIEGKLAGVRQPRADELSELTAAGIGAIVSVLNNPSNLDLYARSGIPHLWLPINEGGSPRQEQIQKLQDFVDVHHRQGLAVAVHCTGGIHRAGTMLAAYLICTGLSYEDALGTIQRANSAVELEMAQLSFLQELAKG